MNFTEADSLYDRLDEMSVSDILKGINQEDKKIPGAIESALSSIETLIGAALKKILKGGRLFYIGAGTSGRLGILDAAECPPTFGVENVIIGIIAGGDKALKNAIENAEDDLESGWIDLQRWNINTNDFVLGISSSGTTPYVIGALKKCKENLIETGAISCNQNSYVSQISQYPIEVIVGPEFVTGSTRMKAGTAEKLILNMISTAVMIKLGRIKGNKMVDMQLKNSKLFHRGVKMIQEELNIGEEEATILLMEKGSVRKVLESKL